MRIVSWNVNGIKSLQQHPDWCHYQDYRSLLNSFDADIISFQEFKLSRSKIDSSIAIIDRDKDESQEYEAYISCSKKKQGYSGVATYCKEPYFPIHAVEGFSTSISSHLLDSTTDNRNKALDGKISSVHELFEDIDKKELVDLDSEGRVLILDFKLFLLFNVYFPNYPSEERYQFKMRFSQLVEKRIRYELDNGRNVILLGDLNVCHQPIDHCDPQQACKERGLENYFDYPPVQWLNGFLSPNGPMIDLFRHFYPNQIGAYTCWNTLINARESNYGTRIDYVICNNELLSWIKDCRILSEIRGSDHCPVIVELHDVHPETGVSLVASTSRKMNGHNTQNEMTVNGGKERTLSQVCTKNWDEFSLKQEKIISFLKVNSDETACRNVFEREKKIINVETLNDDSKPLVEYLQREKSGSKFYKSSQPLKQLKNQKSIKDFFLSKPNAPIDSQRLNSNLYSQKHTIWTKDKPTRTDQFACEGDFVSDEVFPEVLQRLAKLSDGAPFADFDTTTDESTSLEVVEENIDIDMVSKNKKAKQTWKTLLTPKQAPLCYHGEESKPYIVNKPGPNKGRKFYLCGRPVGPGYKDNQQLKYSFSSEKETIDPTTKEPSSTPIMDLKRDQTTDKSLENASFANGGKKRKQLNEYRCDFFQWAKKSSKAIFSTS